MSNENSGIDCPVDKVVSIFNKKWTIQIIRDMFFGKKRFKDFQEDKPGLSNKVLSNCLKDLEDNGIIRKEIINKSPNTTEYYLTEKGKDLNKIIYEMAMFALDKGGYAEYDDENVKNELKDNFKKACNID